MTRSHKTGRQRSANSAVGRRRSNRSSLQITAAEPLQRCHSDQQCDHELSARRLRCDALDRPGARRSLPVHSKCGGASSGFVRAAPSATRNSMQASVWSPWMCGSGRSALLWSCETVCKFAPLDASACAALCSVKLIHSSTQCGFSVRRCFQPTHSLSIESSYRALTPRAALPLSHPLPFAAAPCRKAARLAAVTVRAAFAPMISSCSNRCGAL